MRSNTTPNSPRAILRSARRKAGRDPQLDLFDATAEAARLRAQTRERRAHVRSSSRLDRYAHELLALHGVGATTAELQRWLLAKHVRVHHSTVAHWLRRHEAG